MLRLTSCWIPGYQLTRHGNWFTNINESTRSTDHFVSVILLAERISLEVIHSYGNQIEITIRIFVEESKRHDRNTHFKGKKVEWRNWLWFLIMVYSIGHVNRPLGRWPHTCSQPNGPTQQKTSCDNQYEGKTMGKGNSNSNVGIVERIWIDSCRFGLLHIYQNICVTQNVLHNVIPWVNLNDIMNLTSTTIAPDTFVCVVNCVSWPYTSL